MSHLSSISDIDRHRQWKRNLPVVLSFLLTTKNFHDSGDRIKLCPITNWNVQRQLDGQLRIRGCPWGLVLESNAWGKTSTNHLWVNKTRKCHIMYKGVWTHWHICDQQISRLCSFTLPIVPPDGATKEQLLTRVGQRHGMFPMAVNGEKNKRSKRKSSVQEGKEPKLSIWFHNNVTVKCPSMIKQIQIWADFELYTR